MAARRVTRAMLAQAQRLDTEEDQPQSPEANEDHGPNPTPRKRARTETSIPTKQKLKLTKLDEGRCLVTGESEDRCIDTCHILRRKTVEKEVGDFRKPSLACRWRFNFSAKQIRTFLGFKTSHIEH